MDAMELDFRVRLAEIQRKYKEKQRQLAKLNPKKRDDRLYRRKNVGRPKKRSSRKSSSKSDSANQSDRGCAEDKESEVNETSTEGSARNKSPSSSKDSQSGSSSTNSGTTGSNKGKPTVETPHKSSTKSISCKSPAKSSAKSAAAAAATSSSDPNKAATNASRTSTVKCENTCTDEDKPESTVSALSVKREPLGLSSDGYSSSTDGDSDESSSSQSQYNQNQYNQSPYNQNQYNQSPYNQSQYNQTTYNQNPYNRHDNSDGIWHSHDLSHMTSDTGLSPQFCKSSNNSNGGNQSETSSTGSMKTTKRKRKNLGDDDGVSSKKRKPGRPKKIDEKIATETIVAKKPKNFSFFYGNNKSFGSAFKKSASKASFGNKSAMGAKTKTENRTSFYSADWNRRRSERIFISESRQTATKSTTLDEGCSDKSSSTSTSPNSNQGNQQTTMKTTQSKAMSIALKNKGSSSKNTSTTNDPLQKVKKKTSGVSLVTLSGSNNAVKNKEVTPSPAEPALTPRTKTFSFSISSVTDSDSDSDSSSDSDIPLSSLKDRAITPEPRNCKMTKDDLQHGQSVLFFREGLFYEGTVKAIEPPDIYGVVIKGERGSKAHIIPQEELLNQAVLDVRPLSTRYLAEGTRVCAYWSQQFSCLYPGTISHESPGPGNVAQSDLLSVEFDDGDTGKIPIEHIRMLPADFPNQDEELTMLSSAGVKKRRQTSDDLLAVEAKERKPSISYTLTSYQAGESIKSRIKDSSSSKPDIKPVGTSKIKDTPAAPVKVKDTSSTKLSTSKSKESVQKIKDSNFSKSAEKIKSMTTKTPSKQKVAKFESKGSTDKESLQMKYQRSFSTPAKAVDKNHRGQERSKSVSSNKSNGNVKDDDNQSDISMDDDLDKDEESMDTSSQSGDSDSYSDTEDEEYVPDRQSNQKNGQTNGKPKQRLSDKSVTKSPGKSVSSLPQKTVERRQSDGQLFLPVQQLWEWVGKSTKRPGMKGRAKREYFKSIQRGEEVINVGECAVFLSAGRTLPYVGRIVSLWQGWGGNMVVKVKWFYHPEETKGGKKLAEIRGALYQSPHLDENDVQTISHKCEVLSYLDWKMYQSHRRREAAGTLTGAAIPPDWEEEDVYYLAGTYDPTIGMITFQADVKLL